MTDTPCLLLTATVVTHRDVVFTVRKDASTRLQDYTTALERWLQHDCVGDVVFVENSGYDLEIFRKIAERYPTKRVELLSFASPEYDGALGKGYGEMFCFEHALKSSQILREHRHVVKASGRYSMRNLGDLFHFLQEHQELEAVGVIKRQLTWADSRVFAGSLHFLEQMLVPRHAEINDSAGVCFEHALARAMHQLMAEGGAWSMPPVYMQIEGIHGTDGKAFRSNLLQRSIREFAYALANRWYGGSPR